MSHAAISFPDFVDSLREPSSHTSLSASRLAEALELPAQELAALARVHRNTLQAAPTSFKLQSAMRDVVRALSAAYALCGDIDRALFWFRNHPIPEFGHRTAIDLVAAGKVDAVVDYVESLSAGFTG